MEEGPSPWRTRAVEDFLRTVYLLQQTSAPVLTNAISRALHVKAPTVTEMIQRLKLSQPPADHPNAGYPPLPLVEHVLRHGIRLTPAGEQIALQVIRRRRLLELYLVQVLGFSWDTVDAEAERLEHYLSEELTERLALALENPEVDPHGEPIPTREGTLPSWVDQSLLDMAVGQSGIVRRITDHSPELLRYLADLGLHPGAEVYVRSRSPLGDTITLQIETQIGTQVVSAQVASHLRLAGETKPNSRAADSNSEHSIRGQETAHKQL